jgi:hypothetical protein
VRSVPSTVPRLRGSSPGSSRGGRSEGPTLRADPSGPNSVPESSWRLVRGSVRSEERCTDGLRPATSQVVDVH